MLGSVKFVQIDQVGSDDDLIGEGNPAAPLIDIQIMGGQGKNYRNVHILDSDIGALLKKQEHPQIVGQQDTY